ncbi:glycosyltransferase family 4 protein [Candidatus Pelagibacter sp.]|nr:glycosyltransferase family 4 protein [Candidatus Pelagibacter sp.]
MIKIHYFLDHPIQYQNPLLDKLSLSSKVNLKVIYLSDFSLKPYFDPGLNRTIKFDNIENFKHNHQFIFQNENKSKIRFLFNFTKILIRDKPIFLWVHGYSNFYSIFSIIISFLLGIKVLLRGESNNFFKENFLSRLKIFLFFKIIDPLITSYLAIGKKNEEFYNRYTKKKIFKLPYVVGDLSRNKLIKKSDLNIFKRRYKINEKSFIIFYNAKIIERKNPELLIKSFIQIRKACSKKITLIIAGDGDIKNRLIEKYKNFREIKFVGFINQNLLPKFYSISDLFILPSNYDAWGLVVNEAMSFSIPIITSKNVISSYDLVKHNVNGVIFNNEFHLKQSMINIINNKKIKKKFSKNSNIIIKNWNIETANKHFHKLIES